ncbi:ABC-F family ATP-binding cassette domain-containing protein [Microbacterium sp. STN6]|uniref:ABC-F family ATP-binding cassette domain-containing protein n=1 Tax=Microbacterium sp. STN6 TaxID=2995588 RepID=UPI002260E644|nr:ABC-F family ATP-binding cassette domain-containing protein [Microbacterium sp. STN6]MCX7520906.1 ABC-F family ATP-binding cassette domain-containing protein [Microbacterium sp. STN6]
MAVNQHEQYERHEQHQHDKPRASERERIVRAAASAHLNVSDLSRSYGDRRVLAGVSLDVAPGSRLGLIGESGVGKSTLLRLLAGFEKADAGGIARPERTGFLRQEVPFAPTVTLRELLEDALGEVRGIEAELTDAASALAVPLTDDDGDSVKSANRYAAALEAAERADVWGADARRDAILDGLELGEVSLDRSLGEVSGGQRSRLALAALLLRRPDALLLDEPTNHLDDEAAAFLEKQLVAWVGPIVFASHDRAFLDAVATGLLDLDPTAEGERATDGARGRGIRFGGNYTGYLAAKAQARKRWERQFDAEQAELKELKYAADVTSRSINHARAMTDRNKMSYGNMGTRVQKQVGRRVTNAQGRLEELKRTQVRKPPAQLTFAGIPRGFGTPGGLGTPPVGERSAQTDAGGELLLQATDARVAGRLTVARFTVGPATRILITGHNGAGKSTLLAALAGTLALDGGSIHRRRGLRVGLLEQDVRFADPDASCRALYEKTLGEHRAASLPLTGLGLIAPRDVDRPVASLSIGQQRRLALALIIAKPPHVFLLDEPTNHLSLALAGELEEALGSYPGAVVLASHDRWLRAHWTGERADMRAGTLSVVE